VRPGGATGPGPSSRSQARSWSSCSTRRSGRSAAAGPGEAWSRNAGRGGALGRAGGGQGVIQREPDINLTKQAVKPVQGDMPGQIDGQGCLWRRVFTRWRRFGGPPVKVGRLQDHFQQFNPVTRARSSFSNCVPRSFGSRCLTPVFLSPVHRRRRARERRRVPSLRAS